MLMLPIIGEWLISEVANNSLFCPLFRRRQLLDQMITDGVMYSFGIRF